MRIGVGWWLYRADSYLFYRMPPPLLRHFGGTLCSSTASPTASETVVAELVCLCSRRFNQFWLTTLRQIPPVIIIRAYLCGD